MFINSTEEAFSILKNSALNLLNLTGGSGVNSDWLGSSPRLLTTELTLLTSEVDIAIDTAEKCEGEVSICINIAKRVKGYNFKSMNA